MGCVASTTKSSSESKKCYANYKIRCQSKGSFGCFVVLKSFTHPDAPRAFADFIQQHYTITAYPTELDKRKLDKSDDTTTAYPIEDTAAFLNAFTGLDAFKLFYVNKEASESMVDKVQRDFNLEINMLRLTQDSKRYAVTPVNNYIACTLSHKPESSYYIMIEGKPVETLHLLFLKQCLPIINAAGGTVDFRTFVGDMIGQITRLHANGIIHRDIKPDNIVVCEGQRYTLIDFGGATRMKIGRYRDVFGTSIYMSPMVYWFYKKKEALVYSKSMVNEQRMMFYNLLGNIDLRILDIYEHITSKEIAYNPSIQSYTIELLIRNDFYALGITVLNMYFAGLFYNAPDIQNLAKGVVYLCDMNGDLDRMTERYVLNVFFPPIQTRSRSRVSTGTRQRMSKVVEEEGSRI
jgi:serine/threonine protein kinase